MRTVSRLRTSTTATSPPGAPTSVSTYISEYDPATRVTSTTSDTVTWSATRYTGYWLLAIYSVPGSFGGTSTLRIRGLAEAGDLLDTIEMKRLLTGYPPAGRHGQGSCRPDSCASAGPSGLGVMISTPSVGLTFALRPPIRSLHHVASSRDESL